MVGLDLREARVFITGGAGFIGSHFVEELAGKVNGITIYDKLTYGPTGFEYPPNVKLIKGDLRSEQHVSKAMSGSTLVIHLAANSDIARSAREPDIDFINGQVSTYNVLKAVRSNDIHSLIYFSGSGVYGDKAEYYEETSGPLLPVSPYGASKLGSQAWISAFANLYDIQSWIFRPANVVGERQRHGVVFDFVRKLRTNPSKLEIHGNGKQTKSYVYVKDVVSGVLSALKVKPDPVEIYNISSNDVITVDEIADIVVKEMNLSGVEYVHQGGKVGWKGDVSVIRLSNKKLKGTGWSPSLSSAESIKKAAAWLVSHS